MYKRQFSTQLTQQRITDAGGREFRFRGDLYSQESTFPLVFKLCMTVYYKCLNGLAPKYLAELCVPVADVAGRRQLRSASRGLLNFPRYNMSNYGRRAFCFAGPRVWNSLHKQIRQSTSIAVFKPKTFLL